MRLTCKPERHRWRTRIMATLNRRNFLHSAMAGGIAVSTGLTSTKSVWAADASAQASKVSISVQSDRTATVFQALRPLADDIKKKIGNRPVVIKPNNVSIENQLSATHVDALEGILEFLSSIGIKDHIVIAESAASGPTFEGFDNYGYFKLKNKFNVELIDLDKESYSMIHVLSDENFRPQFVRIANRLLDRDSFIISAAVMKTHDRVVATLSLKNIVFGAPIKDEGFRWGGNRKAGAKNDKPIAHGGGYKGVNYNLMQLSQKLRPDLAVIDGFEGMEGNGPVGGTPVDHKIAVASLDWLAADRTGIELMGIPFSNVGYLNYCYQAGYGEADLSKIVMVGESIEGNVKPYKLHDRVNDQLIWKA